VRAIALLLAADAFFGIWLSWNAPEWVAGYTGWQLPVIGFAGAAWGFLPEDSKKKTGEWVRQFFGLKPIMLGAFILVAFVCAASFFAGTVAVVNAKPQEPIAVWLQKGAREQASDAQITARDSVRLDQERPSDRFVRFAWPVGQSAFVITRTFISRQNVVLRFWKPRRLQFPDDFEEMRRIAFLPNKRLMQRLERSAAELRVTDADDTTKVLASGSLFQYSAYVAFLKPAGVDTAARTRWHQWSRANVDSTESASSTAEYLWNKWDPSQLRTGQWIHSSQPLRKDQRVRYVIRMDNCKECSGELTLSDVVNDVHITK
jgi:hypothetical protein